MDGYKIGNFWTKIPNYERRECCGLCREIESMPHILINCPRSPVKETVWSLAKQLWTMREPMWPQISFGSILGANLASQTKRKKDHRGRDRLLSILLLDSAHLIWKLCCDWTISRGCDPTKLPTTDKVHNKWVSSINL